MNDKKKSVDTNPDLWTYLDRGIKLLQFPLLAGTILSAISTPIIIFAYCKNHQMTFLMPLVFSKITFNTFLLFLIPSFIVLVLPASLGILGGLLGLELKEKTKSTRGDGGKNVKETLEKRGSSSSDKPILWLKKTLMNEIAYQSYSFVSIAFFVAIAVYSLFFGLLLFIFYILLILNGLILYEFMEGIRVKYLQFIIPLILPVFGGGFLGFIYYFVLSKFVPDYHDETKLILMGFCIFLSMIISVFSFWVTLKNIKDNKIIIIGLITIFVFFIYPKLLLWPPFVDSYFSWARYGNIPVRIVSEVPAKCQQKISDGLILFNSGSDLYIKREKDNFDKNLPILKFAFRCFFGKNQIMRVPYKDLERVPSF